MKTFLKHLMCLALVTFTLSSCNLFKKDKDFNESDLIGKWSAKTTKTENPDGYYYVVFYADKDETGDYKLGKEWDEGDDVTEDEAQKFKWRIEKDELQQLHWVEINETWGVPKYYTITVLNSTTLSYNNGNRKYTFTKVK